MAVASVFMLQLILVHSVLPTSLILSFRHHQWRNSKQYSPFLDIRHNLKKAARMGSTHHAFYQVNRASRFCPTKFKNNGVICVVCAAFTQDAIQNGTCRGDISVNSAGTFVDAVTQCSGHWWKLSPSMPGKCRRNIIPRYIFV